jgi:pimeloyl-ACP methyl ester carboxylesterase
MAKAANSSSPFPTVVLVHGAFADGSSWSEVIAILHSKGIDVVAVQNPLRSLADDVDATERAIGMQAGPVLLVGHSWGGTVITQAGNGDRVAGLVYVAAFAPDIGESTTNVQKDHPVPGYVPLLQADAGGFLYLPGEAMAEYFAQDLPLVHSRVLAATQGPIRGSAFDETVTQAAWRSKPTWYVLTEQDRMIAPALQRRFAERMRARVTAVQSSHVPFLSRPKETAAVIVAAADAIALPPLN